MQLLEESIQDGYDAWIVKIRKRALAYTVMLIASLLIAHWRRRKDLP